MKILTITPWFPCTPEDGRFNFIFHSVDALRKKGHQINTLITRPWTPEIAGKLRTDWVRPPVDISRFHKGLGLTVCHYPSIPGNRFYYTVWEIYRLRIRSRVRTLVKRNKIDLIHVHTETSATGAVPLAKELGIPVVVSLHGLNYAPRQYDSSWKISRMRKTLRKADRVVLVGEPLRSFFSGISGGDENFSVIPNGFFLPELNGTEGGYDHGELRIVSVSNLHEGKGIDLTIEALARLADQGVLSWHYMVVGDGNQRPMLEDKVMRYGLQEKISFAGHLDHGKALGHVKKSDLFILPSYREAFGVANLEAMALGVLSIGVRGQGPSTFIRHGVNGLLLEPEDVSSIVECIVFAMENEERCRSMAEQGRRDANREFSWDGHAQKLESLYEEVLNASCTGYGVTGCC